jgi:hypothetical protein
MHFFRDYGVASWLLLLAAPYWCASPVEGQKKGHKKITIFRGTLNCCMLAAQEKQINSLC